MKTVFKIALAAAGLAGAQTPLTLEQAVRQAVERYPAVRVSSERANAAAAAINLARMVYLPQVNMVAQVNRATTNNVYGMLLPQPVVSPISGPPVRDNRSSNVFGSAIGFLVSWEPFDFGLRKAGVDAASAASRRAEAATENTKFEAGAFAADAYLTVLAAEQQLLASEAGVARAKVFYNEIRALSAAGLRPGADEARARAEVALAENQRIQAAQAARIANVSLAERVGSAGELTLSSGPLLGATPGEVEAAQSTHPAAKEEAAAIEEIQARQHILDRSFFPKFSAQGTTFARGTGAHPDFSILGGANGLAPSFYNWGLGFTATFNLTDTKVLAERKKIEAANERAERAKLDLLRQSLDAGRKRAQAMLDGARQIERNVPVQLEAARAAERQASARYRAGLGALADVAEAQRLLTNAEIDNALARLGVWRGTLAIAIAQGNLEGFLKAAK
ncbi:MAG: TolC family protein [Bryobacterales bacterium]|nr:TolC family protein [Bryobacterales bacterium]